MNNLLKKLLVLTLIVTALSCQRADESKETGYSGSRNAPAAAQAPPPPPADLTADKDEETTSSFMLSDANSSSAARVDEKDKTHKFIRRADVRFRVKNVENATYQIEEITKQFEGFVTRTTLSSEIDNKTIIKISEDSSLETTYYNVANTMTLRIPNTKLDTMLKTFTQLIEFLDYRTITADDVALLLLANDLAQRRASGYEDRLKKSIDAKGKKLHEIVGAEDDLNTNKQMSDEARLENMRLKEQISYSTINLSIYQRQSIKRELVANELNIDAYKPSFGSQLADAFKIGVELLKAFIIFIVKIWWVIVIGVIVLVVIRMRK
jgi:hypothetical protein